MDVWGKDMSELLESKEFAEEELLADATELIAEHADNLGLSYRELGKLAGIDSRSMIRYMSGETDLPLRKLVDIFFVTGRRVEIVIKNPNRKKKHEI